MQRKATKLMILIFGVFIVFGFYACQEANQNQTPVATNFLIGNLNQTIVTSIGGDNSVGIGGECCD